MQQRRSTSSAPSDLDFGDAPGIEPGAADGSGSPAANQGEQLRDDVLAVLSHELRTPLATIKGFVDLLVREDASNLTLEQREFLTIIAYNAQRQIAVVDQLLEYAEIRAGRAALSPTALDVKDLLERCVGSGGHPSAGRGAVTFACDRGVPQVLADGDRVLQILGILLEHTRERARFDDHIEVTVLIEAGSVCVEVSDPGPALPASERDLLFSGFRRPLHGESAPASGLSLNLAIARGLAQLQGGDLQLRGDLDSRTTFCLILPQCPVP